MSQESPRVSPESHILQQEYSLCRELDSFCFQYLHISRKWYKIKKRRKNKSSACALYHWKIQFEHKYVKRYAESIRTDLYGSVSKTYFGKIVEWILYLLP